MERKSIGEFIAVQRKAKGMTQRDFAEIINVSDKTVSRWERDECAPDISLLPVIAELFGVTIDELIRGERINADSPQSEYIEKKGKKTIELMLRNAKAGMTVKALIAIGIALLGVIVGAICNFVFCRASLGFWLAAIFFIGAVITEVIFLILEKNKITGLADEDIDTSGIRKAFFRNGIITFASIFMMGVLISPLAYGFSDSYLGIDVLNWGCDEFIVPFVIALAVCTLVSVIVWNVNCGRKGPDVTALRKLRIKLTAIGAGVLVLIFIGIAISAAIIKKCGEEERIKHVYLTIEDWCAKSGCNVQEAKTAVCNGYRQAIDDNDKYHYFSDLLGMYEFMKVEIQGTEYFVRCGASYDNAIEVAFVFYGDVKTSSELSDDEILAIIGGPMILTQEEMDYLLSFPSSSSELVGEPLCLVLIIILAIEIPIYFVKRRKIINMYGKVQDEN